MLATGERIGSASNNFLQTMPEADARKAVGMFKDEYLLDYINVEEMRKFLMDNDYTLLSSKSE